MPAVMRADGNSVRRILVTGFEPFGGADDNPSARLVESLRLLFGSQPPAGLEVAGHVLPVSAARLPGQLSHVLDTLRPDVVLGLGEARGSSAVRVERIALNLLDFRTPDNDGLALRDTAIIPGGPPAYFTTLPGPDLLAAIRAAGVTCEPSLSAGSYICNQMIYLSLHWAARQARAPRVGFLHVPSLPTQNTTAAGACPALDLATQQRALAAALNFIAGQSLQIT